MVQRNSTFPEGIRFQDCKVRLGISPGVSHELLRELLDGFRGTGYPKG